mmetsp:Transcript_47226/g.69260  ORF Transcript_47226/g.69260 Transcript_47226/m.69260 type:complete len:92 (-) Transcript_47226:66-341(-)
MFAILQELRALSLDDGLAKFNQWKLEHNMNDAVDFGGDSPECYSRLTNTFAWNQSVASNGRWAKNTRSSQPAQQLSCPAMNLSIPPEFFTQ